MLKMGIITGFLSQTKDRFHEYNAPLAVEGTTSDVEKNGIRGDRCCSIGCL